MMMQWYTDDALPVLVAAVIDDDGDIALITNTQILRAMPVEEAMDMINAMLRALPESPLTVTQPAVFRHLRMCS